MAKPPKKVFAKTFYLNEQHELTRTEKPGGGGMPQYVGIDWASKGNRIGTSAEVTRNKIKRSRDPLKEKRFFLLAQPVKTLQKSSKDKRKAPEGVYTEDTDFSGKDTRIFRRLGLDLLRVNNDGSAIVHAVPERLDQIIATTMSLKDEGAREQSRWATIDSFDVIPRSLRLDLSWYNKLTQDELLDVVIELQPLLSRVEASIVLQAVANNLKDELKEKLKAEGEDYSGRRWMRGMIGKSSLSSMANDYFSIQSIHPPIFSIVAERSNDEIIQHGLQGRSAPHKGTENLPCVAVVDTGVLENNPVSPYRVGQYKESNANAPIAREHGTFVASRIVFGEQDLLQGKHGNLQAECSYYDVIVAHDAKRIETKSVVPAMKAVAGTNPQIRVFNLSFDTEMPLCMMNETTQQELLLLLQDLDTFIFTSDVFVVVSAGNSQMGLLPQDAYPNHYTDQRWALGSWAQSFNALTCGSYVGNVVQGGLVKKPCWPSPFTRVGPGLSKSPKPDFSANGGNCTPEYKFGNGLGVWGYGASGLPEDKSGTSFSAPILAREAAKAIDLLRKYCQKDSYPYAVAAKAFLALTADRPVRDPSIAKLSDITLGMGTASSRRLVTPNFNSAVMLWQGLLDGPNDIARVKIPIPLEWLKKVRNPHLKLVVAWDTPVNAALRDLWACRKVSVQLRTNPDARAMSGSRGASRSYPIIERLYNLKKLPNGVKVQGDMWLLEVQYKELADYFPVFDFTPQQRVAFAIELFDLSERAISPQGFIQSMPIAATMTRLSIPPQTIAHPIMIKTRA